MDRRPTMRERYGWLCATPPARHNPRPMPAPGPAHYRSLAEDKRREAASILRHVRKSDQGPGPAFARNRAERLYQEAEQFVELAERLEGQAAREVGGGQ